MLRLRQHWEMLLRHPFWHSRWLFGWVVIFMSWGLFFVYLWPQMLYANEFGLQAGWVNIWGDWAAHITYANVFALRPVDQWLTVHPLHIYSAFTYPFLADALSGILMRFGIDVISAFIWPSVVTTLFFLTVLYAFYTAILKKASRGVVAVSLFLLNGGMGWWWFVQDMLTTPTWQTLLYPPTEYTKLDAHFIQWISIISSEVIPQRSFLLGFPLTLLIVWVLWRWAQQKFDTVSLLQLVFLGVGSGTLLFVHAHSFIALFCICAVMSFASIRLWRQWAVYAIATCAMAIPILLALHAGNVGGFITFFPGWYANSQAYGINWFYFWWVNYGVFLPLAIWGTYRKQLYRQPLVVAGWVIFVGLNLFNFQPHIWDNTKLLTWTHLFLVIPVWHVLADIYHFSVRKYPVGRLLAGGVFVLLTFSSTLDVWRLTRVEKNSYQMWSREEFSMAEELNQLSQPGERVLTGLNHDNWVVAHTHLQTLHGYPGWLWTYGVFDPELTDDVRMMFSGGAESCRLLEEYDVRYVAMGWPETVDLSADKSWFDEMMPVVVSGSKYVVYEVPAELDLGECDRIKARSTNEESVDAVLSEVGE